ncbi:MAG: cell division ATP-binding protein FtsE [Gammaproteobacteria bacterium]|jgi:cell division transport system ATP-binding protein
MIKLVNVSKRYPGGHEALNNVSCHLEKGDMAFLTGHSGAGKSTLLKLITMIERTTRGEIVLDGKNLSRVRRRQIPFIRRKIGMVFQDHNLLYDKTVFDNVALPLIIAGEHHSETGRRVRAALDKVGLLGREKEFPVTLSTGEQQRVGIARAVVNRPPVLLADEPTGNLDPELSREIMALFEAFNNIGATVLIATHDLELIKQIPQRLLTLQQGRLVADTSVQELTRSA